MLTPAMQEIFVKLMDSAGVPAEAHAETLSQISALKVQFPTETPARLFARARKEGAPIPPSRCAHAVVRGECVTCDSKIGARLYFTAGGSLVHARPTCDLLRAGANGSSIESAAAAVGVPGVAEVCTQCPPVRASRAGAARPRASRAAGATARPVVPRVLPGHAPTTLVVSDPPSSGDRIDWGGYVGVVTDVDDKGVRFTVEGISLTAPWGDRARVRHAPS